MGSTLSAVKTLIVPAVISLILFIVCSYILLPLWRQYRQRYSQYLPLETISNHTTSFRVRVQNAITKWIIPARWRMSLRERLVAAEGSDAGFDSDDGEELEDVDEERRHAISLDTSGRSEHTDSGRRLSRDLEEGFMDESDDEPDNRQRSRSHILEPVQHESYTTLNGDRWELLEFKDQSTIRQPRNKIQFRPTLYGPDSSAARVAVPAAALP